MKSMGMDDWLQTVGLVGVIASLIFVGMQLKESEDTAYEALSESTIIRGIEMSAWVSEHADVWYRACLGQELTPAEQVIAGNIYFRYTHANFNSWIRGQTTDSNELGSQFLIDSFAANIHRYPGFRKMALSWNDWREMGARFENPLLPVYRDKILARLNEFEKNEPSPNAEIMWCGVR